MKKYAFLGIILFLGIFVSCKKEIRDLETKEDITIPQPCIGCVSGGGVTTYTDEELQVMGQAVGCQLATSNNGAPLSVIVGYQLVNGVQQPIYGPNSIYSVYLNTVNNPNAPEIYKDGVRSGWIDCFSRGEATPNICRDITIYDGPRGFVTVNYCNWIGASDPRTPIQ